MPNSARYVATMFVVTTYPVDQVAFVWLGLGVRFARDEVGA